MAELPPDASPAFDWNPAPSPEYFRRSLEINDETLRDGLQSPSAHEPSFDDKCALLSHMADIGVRAASVGMPAAGPRALTDVAALARYAADAGLALELNSAARTLVGDVAAVVEASQRAGRALVVHAFIGSSPVRMCAEGWDATSVMRRAREAIDFAVAHGLEVGFVTEDTTRTPPDVLGPLLRMALDQGASRLVLCDTVGQSLPEGARALVAWVRSLVAATGGGASVEWHGHNDRGLALANAMAAFDAGAYRIHTCALGVGERCGNTPTELLLLNARLDGHYPNDLRGLAAYVERASVGCRVPIPRGHPLFGRDAFRTATGVHAAAIGKALARGDGRLADRVYSAVPAGDFGRAQIIEVGPQSGASNVRIWLGRRGLPAGPALCDAILAAAKTSGRVLTEAELLSIVARCAAPSSAPSGSPSSAPSGPPSSAPTTPARATLAS